MSRVLTEIFLLLFCEKNSDGTKNLVLRGNDLQIRINKRICPCDMVKICLFLKKHKEIVNVDLSYNPIKDVGFEVLVDTILYRENNLLSLTLVSCDITDDGIKYLCENVRKLTLTELRLNGNQIGVEGGQTLALYLDTNTSVQHLDLAETDQTLQSIAYYMQILNNDQGRNKTIKVLNISRIIPYFNRYNYNFEHLADCINVLLASNKTLVELHLQKCQFDGHDIQILVSGLKNNKTLLFLDLGYNRMGDLGIEEIAGYLRTCPPLLGLNVAANGIKDTGARALSFGMPFSRIRLLDIGCNQITDVGLLDILYSIKKPVQIRILNIWGNKITHKTNIVIKRMFRAGVLNPNLVDVVVYEVDKVLYAAYNPSDMYKHKYYCELDYGPTVTQPLKIKRNELPKANRFRVDFKYYPTIPAYESTGPPHREDCICCICSR